jgi:hypothetical protein
MSYAPFPLNDGSNSYDPVRTERLRLKDAEKIAAERLDIRGDGTLKEALADVGPSLAASIERSVRFDVNPAVMSAVDEIERLTGRIEAAQAEYQAVSAGTSTLPFPAEPIAEAAAREVPVDALLDLREWSEAQARVAAELTELPAQPVDADQGSSVTSWQPVQRDTEPYMPPANENLVQDAAVEPVYAEPVYLEPVYAQPEPARPEPARPEPARPEPVRPEPVRLELVRSEPAPEPVKAEPHTRQEGAPIAEALDTAAKLTADASVAAAALENLALLLQKHQRTSPMMPPVLHGHDQDHAQVQQQHVPQPQPQPRPIPMPRPAAAFPQQQAAKPAVVQTTAHMRPVKAPALRSPSALPESRQFDVRGFMAGFALSWAIGAVLYIYLLAG